MKLILCAKDTMEGESLEDFGHVLELMTFHGHGFELVVGVTNVSMLNWIYHSVTMFASALNLPFLYLS